MTTANYSLVLKMIRNLIRMNPDKGIQVRRDNAVKLETRTWENGIHRDVLFTVEGRILLVVVKYVTDSARITRRCQFDLEDVHASVHHGAYDNDVLFAYGFVKADDALELLFEFLRHRGVRNYLTYHNMYSYAVAYERQLEMLADMKHAMLLGEGIGDLALFKTAFKNIAEVLNMQYKQAVGVSVNSNCISMKVRPIGVTAYGDKAIEVGIHRSGKKEELYVKLYTHKSNVFTYIVFENGVNTSLNEIYNLLYPYVNVGITEHTNVHLRCLLDVFKEPIYNMPMTLTLAQWSKLIMVTPINIADTTWALHTHELEPRKLDTIDLVYLTKGEEQ